MNEITINIGWEFFFGILGSLIIFAWYGSSRFTRMEVSFDDVKRRISNVESKVFGLAGASSPISLTEKGQKVLELSGLIEFIPDNIDMFISHCKKIKEMDTAYDVQEAAFDIFDSFSFDEATEKKIKEAAYQEGVDFDVVRRVGGIYLRDKILEKLGMQGKDIDGVAEAKRI